jgi:predicted membrane GTPase involved in stress response
MDMSLQRRIAGRNKGSLFLWKRKAFLILLINYKIVFVEPNAEIYEGQVIGENSW